VDALTDRPSSEEETASNPFEQMTGEQLIDYAVQHFNDDDGQDAGELDISTRSAIARSAFSKRPCMV
jgi:hypothetical protein